MARSSETGVSPGATLKPVTVAVGPPDGKPAPIVTACVANSGAPTRSG